MKSIKSLMAALAVASAPAFAAPSLIGDSVIIRNEFPLGTILATANVVVSSPGVEIVCPATCLSGGLLSGESIDIDALSITMNFGTSSFGGVGFNGFEFDDLDFGVGVLTGVSLSTSNVTGLELSDLWFDANTVRVNLSGIRPNNGFARINLAASTPGVPVPTPGTLALALAALLLAGVARLWRSAAAQ